MDFTGGILLIDCFFAGWVEGLVDWLSLPGIMV
jgi:hypothetical protein